MNNWYIVYETETGQCKSIGSVVADPLPEGLSLRALSEEEAEGLRNGTLFWDSGSVNLISAPLPKVSAEDWLKNCGIGGERQPVLMYLRQGLVAANKQSPALDSLEQYLQIILGIYAETLEPRNDWPLPPVSFEEAVAQTMAILKS